MTARDASEATDIYKRLLLESRDDLALTVFVATYSPPTKPNK